jgi:hypothetical protein
MRIASTIGATSVQHDGVDYEAGDDGMFEVPQQVGEQLVRFSEWEPETAHVEAQNAAQRAADLDPENVVSRLEALEALGEEAAQAIEALQGAVEALKSAKPAARSRAKQTD